jgi:predicted nucleic acid-binding Zn finger protein
MGEGGSKVMASQVVENKDRREGKGRVIAISRKVYRIQNSDVFYVESESKDEMYYYVMFDTAKNFLWCSCKDFEKTSYRSKCKHLFGVEFAIRMNTVKDTDKLPENTKKDNNQQNKKSWRDDEYEF